MAIRPKRQCQTGAKSLYEIPCGKGIFTKEEFLEMVRAVNKEMENRRNKR
jgi:hypothetical protein